MSSLGPRGMRHPYQAILRRARPQMSGLTHRSSCCITLARPLVSLRSTISLARHGSAMLSQFQQRTLRTYVPLDVPLDIRRSELNFGQSLRGTDCSVPAFAMPRAGKVANGLKRRLIQLWRLRARVVLA